ncbi:MAG: PD-(D/E)XK nuclease domain-containing protein, partial [Bifidobacteriaceae bacterium]|nr:PD-(D/E)XK nuclease domain-containing protein [Bifidobacteriaceae bacterium]
LFQTGYLTIKGINPVTGAFILKFPNNEVKYGFYNSLMNYFVDNNKKIKRLTTDELIDDLVAENIEDFFSRITAFYSGIPYDLENKKEAHYQTIFYVLLAKYIKVEEHTATGSADAIIELPDQVYIFEFKMSNNGTAKDAIQQIDTQGYAKKYNNPSETRKIYKVGVVFDVKERTIVEYLVNE